MRRGNSAFDARWPMSALGVDRRASLGHIDAEIFAICIAGECLRISPAAEALREIDAFQRELQAKASRVTLATAARHIRDAKAGGRIAGILGLEGAEPLEGEIGLLRIFYQLGVRNIGLTWNLRNAAADGVHEHESGGGLTRFGVHIVEEANRLGMIVDVARSNDSWSGLKPADWRQPSVTPVSPG